MGESLAYGPRGNCPWKAIVSPSPLYFTSMHTCSHSTILDFFGEGTCYPHMSYWHGKDVSPPTVHLNDVNTNNLFNNSRFLYFEGCCDCAHLSVETDSAVSLRFTHPLDLPSGGATS